MLPNFREERKLWKKGYKRVVGLDEAGRGALGGPVVAVAVIINPKPKTKNQKLKTQIKNKKINNLGIRDSKRLTPKKREEIYKILINHSQIKWGRGRVSEKVIDKINILEATKLAMKRAVRNLEKKLRRKASFLILDGNMKIDYSHGPIRIPRSRAKRRRGLGYSHAIPQKSIIKADNKVFSCATASILAKVRRDRMMERYDKRYPQYGFSKHKGYATKLHLKMLKKYGPCKIHRKSFKPINEILNPKS
ncbi:MAG: ribonuclease HII [Candidatus Paceibacterales bacterium]